jgi:transketolase
MKRAARGITGQQIREAIDQLVADDQEPTTTSIRSIIGSGSFMTIGTALDKWRDEQLAGAKAQVPKIPNSVNQLFQRIWIEAWRTANDHHETERSGFRAERQDWSKERGELMAEISQLESKDSDQLAKLEQCEADTREQTERLSAAEQTLAAAHARTEVLEAENNRLRDDRQQLTSQLAAISERAATAEALLNQSAPKEGK